MVQLARERQIVSWSEMRVAGIVSHEAYGKARANRSDFRISQDNGFTFKLIRFA